MKIPELLNVNGPGFAGLYAGDSVEFSVRITDFGGRGDLRLTHTAVVLPLLVFTDHVQVKHGPFGYTVNADNFVRLVRRGKRHIVADAADRRFGQPHYGHEQEST